MGELIITVGMLLFVVGAVLLFARLSKRPTPLDDGGRGIRDRTLAEGRSMQDRNDGIDIA